MERKRNSGVSNYVDDKLRGDTVIECGVFAEWATATVLHKLGETGAKWAPFGCRIS